MSVILHDNVHATRRQSHLDDCKAILSAINPVEVGGVLLE